MEKLFVKFGIKAERDFSTPLWYRLKTKPRDSINGYAILIYFLRYGPGKFSREKFGTITKENSKKTANHSFSRLNDQFTIDGHRIALCVRKE